MRTLVRLGLLAAAPLLLLGYCAGTPHATAVVPWPDPRTRVRVEIRGILSEDWWIVVESGGRFEQEMWSNWGPARRANLYRTEDGGLAVIGAGMLAAVVALPPRGPPGAVPRGEDDDGVGWRYVGAVVLGYGPFRFRAPEELPECIPLYGLGSVPVRLGFQERPVQGGRVMRCP